MNFSFCAPLCFSEIYGPSKWMPPKDGISFLTLLTVLVFAVQNRFSDTEKMPIAIEMIVNVLVITLPIGLTIIKPLLEATDGLNILLYPISTLFSALFNSDFAYYEYGVLNAAYVTTAYTGNGVLPLAEFITQTMYGFAMFIAPTSVVLLFTLSLLDIKYTTWLKKIIFVILELLLVIFLSYVVLNLWVI